MMKVHGTHAYSYAYQAYCSHQYDHHNFFACTSWQFCTWDFDSLRNIWGKRILSFKGRMCLGLAIYRLSGAPYPTLPIRHSRYTETDDSLRIWQKFIPFESFQVFQRGGYYSVEVIPNQVAVISLNTMYFYDSNKGEPILHTFHFCYFATATFQPPSCPCFSIHLRHPIEWYR